MKLLLLLVCGLTLLRLKAAETHVYHRSAVTSDVEPIVSSILARLDDVEKQNSRLLDVLDRQTKEHNDGIKRLMKENTHQNEIIERLTRENTQQQEEIEQLKSTNSQKGINSSSVNPRQTPEPDTRSQFTALGCYEATISLSCPSGRTIFVTTGNYGKYDDVCSAGCCPPNPQYDCTELIEENSPQDWFVIKELCDNKTSCVFENPGSGIDECEFGYLADYMQLFYDCLPDDDTGPVAFTASAETGTSTSYSGGDIVVFDEIITNFGGHYNPATSSFICPVDGVYLLSVSVTSATSNAFEINLMRTGTLLAGTYGNTISGDNSHASATVVTECSRGEALWVRAVGGTSTIYAFGQYSLFAGHLIQRL